MRFTNTIKVTTVIWKLISWVIHYQMSVFKKVQLGLNDLRSWFTLVNFFFLKPRNFILILRMITSKFNLYQSFSCFHSVLVLRGAQNSFYLKPTLQPLFPISSNILKRLYLYSFFFFNLEPVSLPSVSRSSLNM